MEHGLRRQYTETLLDCGSKVNHSFEMITLQYISISYADMHKGDYHTQYLNWTVISEKIFALYQSIAAFQIVLDFN